MTTSKVFDVVVRSRIEVILIDGEASHEQLAGAAQTAAEEVIGGEYEGPLLLVHALGGPFWQLREYADFDALPLAVVDWCITDQPNDHTIMITNGVTQ